MAPAGTRIRVPVAVACKVLKLSRQAYYQWLVEPVCQRDWDDAHAINVLREIHEDDPTLGYRFLTDELGDVGITASENRVWRLCQAAGVFAAHHRRRAKARKPGPPVHDDLLAFVDEHGVTRHDFTATGPDQKWLTDISEHPTAWIPAIVATDRLTAHQVGHRRDRVHRRRRQGLSLAGP
jgi:putative transposase